MAVRRPAVASVADARPVRTARRPAIKSKRAATAAAAAADAAAERGLMAAVAAEMAAADAERAGTLLGSPAELLAADALKDLSTTGAWPSPFLKSWFGCLHKSSLAQNLSCLSLWCSTLNLRLSCSSQWR